MPRMKDPVCGMAVDSASAAGTSTHGSETYYFCSQECLRRFEAEPAKYVGARLQKGGKEGRSTPEPEEHEPPHTTRGGFTAPKFGAAGSGGAEYEPLPETHDKGKAP